ncbi:helix-turn-helix domain-containing protein [Runella sp. CRIBMP]|uniref:helix-turn-helix domain-containing protein n=1 Tax=Runella sp. CRIBMP TaxID=2683261 RepID=UPI001411F9AC|nr:helix-turn-helix transcriptional regulator [Runella sp. CRIBMP]NBB19361.1 helix-turn-helix domain-containing protein [Runella sp. CRIBMP]
MSIGEKLRKRRNELGLTQEWVALELSSQGKNISQPTYNNWENGKSCPSIEQVQALTKILRIKLPYLVSDTDTDTEKWRAMAEEYAEKCRMLEKMNVVLLKENEKLRDA